VRCKADRAAGEGCCEGSRLPRILERASKVKGLGDYVTLSVNFSELKEAAELL